MRPDSFNQIIGQRQVIDPLRIMIAAAKAENRALPHVLLVGAPGLGKTTIARAIANETGGRLHEMMAAKLDDRASLLNVMLGAADNDVIFLDEIHALKRETAESIYTAMEDCRMSLVIGEGEHATVVQRQLAKFTLVGATTEAGRILKPMRDRFRWRGELTFYSEAEIVQVLQRESRRFTPEAASVIARRALGTPRIALRLAQQCLDYAAAAGVEGAVSGGVALSAMQVFGVLPLGLSAGDAAILRELKAAGIGKARGVNALASALSIAENVIEEMHEPVLLRMGLIARTGKGRMITPAGLQYLEDLNV